jgi:divalent metal cation (Fe/Co/Zn/Cd) transporter
MGVPVSDAQGASLRRFELGLMIITSPTGRVRLIRRAFTLEWLTLGWMSIEAAVAIGAGLVAHSLTLVAFGLDSVIELASALVLMWRLNAELRKGAAFSEAAEERASKIGGALLFALAAYVIVSAGLSLWHRQGAEFSTLGLALAIIAIPTMYALSRAKLGLAEQLGSGALRADAVEAITCGYLSFVVVIGITAQLLFHAWWVDGVTSLAIVYFLVKEGREAWEGANCCEH